MDVTHGWLGIEPGEIVVGLDVHDGWEHALDWAVDEAILERRALTIVQAMDGTNSLWHNPIRRTGHVGVLDRSAPVQLFLDDARAHALARAPELMVHELLHSGEPRHVLASAASNAEMLVIGAQQRRHIWPRFVGSVSASIARRPPSAVVVVPPEPRHDSHDGVLVGIDDDGSSRTAMRFAFAQASLHGWPLTVMHVAPDPLRVDRENERRIERLHLAKALASASLDHPDVLVRTTLGDGDPAQCLASAARTMGLLVLGASRGRAIADVHRGSVVGSIVETAGCSVAVVPQRAG